MAAVCCVAASCCGVSLLNLEERGMGVSLLKLKVHGCFVVEVEGARGGFVVWRDDKTFKSICLERELKLPLFMAIWIVA